MKKKEPTQLEPPKLSDGQYWEWRTTIGEMDIASRDFDIVKLQYESLMKDQEILKFKSALMRKTLGEHEGKKVAARNEYDRFKKTIEDKIGFSLNGCTIDDVTHQIKKLEE